MRPERLIFVPRIIADSRDLIDEIALIKSDDAIGMARTPAEQRGLLAEISSGANLLAAKQMAAKCGDATIVTILPDGGGASR